MCQPSLPKHRQSRQLFTSSLRALSTQEPMPLSTNRPKRATAARTYEDEGPRSKKDELARQSPGPVAATPVTVKSAGKRQKIAPVEDAAPAAAPAATLAPASPPLPKLLSIQRTVTVERAQAEIISKDAAKAAAESAVKEAQRLLRATRKVTKDGRKKVLKDAEAAVETAKAAVPLAERALAAAKRDAVPDDVRILKRLEEELAAYGKKAAMGGAVVHDLCVLHAAGAIDEQPLTRAVELMTSAAGGAAIAATALGMLVRLAGTPETGEIVPPASLALRRRTLCVLCEWFVTKAASGASDGAATRTSHDEDVLPLIWIAKAMGMHDGGLSALREPGHVDRFVGKVLERATAMRADAASPTPVQSGVAAGLQALLNRTKPPVDELAVLKRQCPLMGLLLPVHKWLGGEASTAGALSGAASIIHAALKEGLQSALQAAIPDQPDYSLAEAAAIVGTQNQELSTFLASPTERELRYDAGSTGRMRLHHLIQEALGGRHGLRHESEGYGGARVLMITKMSVATPEMLAIQRRLQKLQRQALSELV